MADAEVGHERGAHRGGAGSAGGPGPAPAATELPLCHEALRRRLQLEIVCEEIALLATFATALGYGGHQEPAEPA